MKVVVKICIKIICIVLITLFLLLSFSNYFRPNKLGRPSDMTSKVDGFYLLEDNSMDVLFFGTSHMFYSVNPSILWKENQLTSYVFGGECQPLEITLQYMKEAFKTQHPKLVVLDIFGVSNSIESCRTAGSAKVNTEDLKLNQDKIDAIRTYDQDVLFNIFDVAKYHHRILEMSTKDYENGFKKFDNTNFGFTLAYPYGQYQSDYIYSQDMDELQPDADKLNLLTSIIKLCHEQDIEIILIKTPYYASDEDAQIYNYIEKYSKENGIGFINFNKMLDEIDYKFDFDGSIWHSNCIGSMKISTYLSHYIQDKVHIVTSKNLYAQEYNRLYVKTEVAMLSKTTDILDWIKIAKSLDGTIILNYQGSDNLWLPEDKINCLVELGLDMNHIDENQIVLINQDKTSSNDNVQFVVNDHKIDVNTQGGLLIDDMLMNSSETNLTLSIIDNSTGYLVDTISVSTVGDTYIYRK